MNHANTGDWIFGWDWLLWIAFVWLLLSSFGTWGYTYSAHRRIGILPGKAALAILNERYARGELSRAQFLELKSDIANA